MTPPRTGGDRGASEVAVGGAVGAAGGEQPTDLGPGERNGFDQSAGGSGVTPPAHDAQPPTAPPTASPDAVSPPPPEPDAAAPPAPADCTGGVWRLQALGSARETRVDVPAHLPRGAPLILALHGNGDTAENFCAWSELCAFGTAHGALVLTPQGRNRVIHAFGQVLQGDWDAYNVDPGQNEDLTLIDALLAEADRRCAPGDVYVWGHSQGGFLGFTVAMLRSAQVAGAAISAASDPLPGYDWRPSHPLPFYFLIGDQDFGIDAARDTATRLRAAGHPVELNVLPGVGHGGYPRGFNDAILAFIGGG